MPVVLLPAARFERWVGNFVRGHGATRIEVVPDGLGGSADDGSWFRASLPFSATWDPAPSSSAQHLRSEPDVAQCALVAGLGESAVPPGDWGLLLVRKGGFAVARLTGPQVTARKTGRRHVQGRTKAGGQSQQRFARRREGQARTAYGAAADHAAGLLAGGPRARLPVVLGGDRAGVSHVLEDPRLSHLQEVGPWLAVPDPRGAVLDRAVVDGQALVVEVHNT